MGYPNPGPVQGYWGAGSSNPYPYQNPYAVPFDRVYPEKPRVPLQKRDMVFFALFAAATFLFMDFAVFGGFALGFSIAYVVLFVLTTLYLSVRETKKSAFGIVCGLLSLAGCVVPALARDLLINTLDLFLTAFLYSLYVGGLCGGLTGGDALAKVATWWKNTVVAPFRHVAEPFRSMAGESRKSPHFGQALLGLLLALPVLFLVVPLLMQADAAYESMMTGILDHLGGLVFRLVLTVLTAPLLVSLLFSYRKRLEPPCADSRRERLQVAGTPFFIALLSCVSLFYLSYLFSQLAYFFSAFSGMLPDGQGFTSAAYARRGFFELTAIAAVNILLLLLVLLLAKRGPTGRISPGVKALSLFIGVFTLLLGATAFSKMVLYIRLYGMTRLRVLTSVFMIGLSVLMVSVLFRLFIGRFPFLRVAVAVSAVLLLSVGFADVDRFVAGYNVQAYRDGSLPEVDVEHLGSLSVSAVPEVARLLDDADPAVAESARKVMERWFIRMAGPEFHVEGGVVVDERGFSLRRFNLAQERAYNCLRQQYPRYCSVSEEEAGR